MANEVRADPVELSRLAAAVLAASQQLSDGWRATQDSLAVPRPAYGDSAGAPGVAASYEAAGDDADVAIGRLVAVLEGDVDRLYRVAFAYEKADRDAAARARRAGGRNQPI